ncbi:GntR family transcriptional regulator [Lacticaseibacillus jixiensis]|uniref:GntR family transcriptional regulator n=1 Tax=Lacticaseibacillus jixiensis TaxID=3231926 RepID=UPI0036F27626
MANPLSAQGYVYELLKRQILHFELKPDERLHMKTLTESLNVGATPLREAIGHLRTNGLVAVFAQSGSFVSRIDENIVRQSHLVRKQIEGTVIRETTEHITSIQLQNLQQDLAMQQVYLYSHDFDRFFDMDEQFHRHFYQIAEKPAVWKWMETINLQYSRLRYLHLEFLELNWQQLYQDHVRILDAISAHDGEGAVALNNQHLGILVDDLAMVRKIHPEYFA